MICLLVGEMIKKVDKLAMDLSHPYLSIYLDSVWWKIQCTGMLKWKYWEYSFVWWTIIGIMKDFPSARVKTSNTHQNDAWSLPYVNLSHGASSSFLSIFWFWKIESFFLPYPFFEFTRTKFSSFLSALLIWITSRKCSITLQEFYKAWIFVAWC